MSELHSTSGVFEHLDRISEYVATLENERDRYESRAQEAEERAQHLEDLLDLARIRASELKSEGKALRKELTALELELDRREAGS